MASPGIPERFKVTEIQRHVPRTEPPSEPAPPKKHEREPELKVEKTAHGWRFTAPVAILVAILSSLGGLFAGRQTAPAVDQTQAILELRVETRADIADIKRTLEAM